MAFTNGNLENVLTTVTSGNITFPAPDGSPSAGDLYIAEIVYRDSPQFSAPAGWTIDAHVTTGDTTPVGGKPNALLAHIVRGASEPDLTFTRTGGDMALGRILVYTPASGNAYVVTSATAESSTSGTNIVLPSVTTANVGDLIHVYGALGRNTNAEPCTSTDPATGSGTTTDLSSSPTTGSWINRRAGGSTIGADAGYATFDGVHSTTGATGAITVAADFTASHWAGLVVVYADGTPPADTQEPTLSNPTVTAVDSTTSDGAVTTDEANGTLYAIVSTSATPPSVAQIQAGNDSTGSAASFAVGSGAGQAVSATGVQSVSATGLTPSTSYFWHYQHKDAANNDSTVSTTAQFTTTSADVTPPTLTSPTGVQTGATTATIGATTNEGNGTLYGVVTVSGTAPTQAQVKLGQDSNGVAATFAGSLAISSTGAKTINATGLTASTSYFAHLMHEDAATNQSTVVSSVQFTTTAADTIAPNLTSPTGTQTGSTTASGSVTTDEGNGTLFAVVSTSGTPPSVAQIQAGNDSTGSAAAFALGSGSGVAVPVSGVRNVTATGLTPSTAYFWHYQQQDASGNDSTVVSSATFTTDATDTTPPLFSVAPSVSVITPTGATLNATINETGDIFAVVVPQADNTPTPAEVVAGQASGGGSPSASVSVTNNTVMATEASGLSALTDYKAVFVARDTAGNLQTTTVAVNFTTSGVLTAGMKNGAGTPRSVEAFTYLWFAGAGTLSAMATATRTSSTGTTEADGTAVVPHASPGIAMLSFADGSVYYEVFV